MENVLNGGGIEVGIGCNSSLLSKLESRRESTNGSGYAVSAGSPKFHEIVRGGYRHQELPIVAQHPPEFQRIHPRRDRQNDGKRAVFVRNESVRIGHNPLVAGVTARRRIYGCNRDVDAMRREPAQSGETPDKVAIAAPCIQNSVAGRSSDHFGDAMEQRLSHTAIVQTAPAGDSGFGIARIPGAPVLRLKQVNVSAARDVE